MRLGFRARLFLIGLALVVVSELVASWYLSGALERQLGDRVRRDLFVRLQLIEDRATRANIPLDNLERWDRLADELAAHANAQVSVIRWDGVVLGDSEVPRAQIAAADNVAAHPEVAAALTRGRASSTRYGRSTRELTAYVATTFGSRIAADGVTTAGPAGVVRLAMPLSEVDDAIASTRRVLWVAGGLAVLVALLASAVIGRRLSAAVRTLDLVARRLGEGELDARTRAAGPDELGRLGRTLDQLAANLKKAVGELRTERDLLSGILDAMEEGVLVLDAEGRIVVVNPALRGMLLLGADLAGRSPLEVIRHADLQELITRATEDGASSGEIEVTGVKPRRLLVRAAALRREPHGMLVVLVDVTDLRRLESLRRDFVANVSHELRTPITAVRSAAETLRGGAAADAQAGPRFVDMIERNAERLQRLVEDLLDLSRIESRQFQLRPEPVAIPPLLALIEEGLRQQAARRRVSLKVQLPPDLPAAQADRRALEQVLTNLIDNAVKYCVEGGDITTRVAVTAPGELTISVADTGPGIEAKHLPRLFERFYRVDTGRSRDQGGTGLGLSIVKHLVEAMGGTIRVESTVGKGSTFLFTVPCT